MTAPNDVAALVVKLRYQAMEAAKRFIDWRFGNDNSPPRISIPARPDYDDDLVLVSTLKEAAATIAALQAEVERAKTYWTEWARKRATVQEAAWMRAAELAVAGDLRALKNRIDMVKAGPIAIELSEAARSASRKENTP